MSLYNSFDKSKHFSELGSPLVTARGVLTPTQRRNEALVNLTGVSGLLAADFSQLANTDAAGAITSAATAAGVAVQEAGAGRLHITKFTLTSVALAITDSGANGGHGSLQLYDFPEGAILFMSSWGSLDLTGSGGVGAATVFDLGFGTTATATDNAELSTTEANVLLWDEATLSSSVLANTVATNVVDAIIDGTSTALDLFLNASGDATGVTANGVLTIGGEATVVWINMGDD